MYKDSIELEYSEVKNFCEWAEKLILCDLTIAFWQGDHVSYVPVSLGFCDFIVAKWSLDCRIDIKKDITIISRP